MKRGGSGPHATLVCVQLHLSDMKAMPAFPPIFCNPKYFSRNPAAARTSVTVTLITAGSSIHWMDWSVVFPRFRDALTAHGVLAVVEQSTQETPWQTDVQAIINRLSTNRDYRPYDIIDELESRNLFRQVGRHQTPPAPFRQRVGDYVESFHSRNGLSRDRMGADAAIFDRELTAVVEPHAIGGYVTLSVVGTVVWGAPAPHT